MAESVIRCPIYRSIARRAVKRRCSVAGEEIIELGRLLSVGSFDGSNTLNKRHESVLVRARSRHAFLLKDLGERSGECEMEY